MLEQARHVVDRLKQNVAELGANVPTPFSTCALIPLRSAKP